MTEGKLYTSEDINNLPVAQGDMGSPDDCGTKHKPFGLGEKLTHSGEMIVTGIYCERCGACLSALGY